jgi:hypothetical protein
VSFLHFSSLSIPFQSTNTTATNRSPRHHTLHHFTIRDDAFSCTPLIYIVLTGEVAGLSGFAIFVRVSGIFLALFLLCVPVVYEKYDKLTRLARALKESTRWIHSRWQRIHLQPAHRVRFHLVNRRSRADTRLYRFITTISAWTEPGCKNADNDPHASLGDSFKSALPGWCEMKKAGAIFFWLAFGVFIPRDAFFGLTRPLFSGFWLASQYSVLAVDVDAEYHVTLHPCPYS